MAEIAPHRLILPQLAADKFGSSVDSDSTLGTVAARAGYTVGCELGGWRFNQGEAEWVNLFTKEFTMATIDYGLHWAEIEPERGRFDWSIMDRSVSFAQDHGMRIRGLHLVFATDATSLPSWVRAPALARGEMINILTTHIATIMERYRGQVQEWSVVNEPYLSYANDQRSVDPFFKAIGPDYLQIAFEAARAADPNAKLIYNDSGNHSNFGGSNGYTTETTRENVNRLNANKLVDLVGMQMHLNGTQLPDPSDVEATMNSYSVPVAVTEMDINLQDLQGMSHERLQLQARAYSEIHAAIFSSGVCRTINYWGTDDRYSWLVLGGQTRSAPTLFDEHLVRKPAYYAVHDRFTSLVR